MDVLDRPKRNRSKSEKAQMNDAIERKAELLKTLHVASTTPGEKRKRDSALERGDPLLSSDDTTEGLGKKVQRVVTRHKKQSAGPTTLPKKTLTRFRSVCVCVVCVCVCVCVHVCVHVCVLCVCVMWCGVVSYV